MVTLMENSHDKKKNLQTTTICEINSHKKHFVGTNFVKYVTATSLIIIKCQSKTVPKTNQDGQEATSD